MNQFFCIPDYQLSVEFMETLLQIKTKKRRFGFENVRMVVA